MKGFTYIGADSIIGETPKAILVAFRDREVWLPKSQVRLIEVTEGVYEGQTDVWVANWLAARNRMMY